MKMMLVIAEKSCVKEITRSLNSKGLIVTKINSVGGFLEKKIVTLMSVVYNEEVELAIDIIRKTAKKQNVSLANSELELNNLGMSMRNSIPLSFKEQKNEITVGGATVFIVDVEQMHKF